MSSDNNSSRSKPSVVGLDELPERVRTDAREHARASSRLGLKPVPPKLRACMQCTDEFLSLGDARCCNPCRTKARLRTYGSLVEWGG